MTVELAVRFSALNVSTARQTLTTTCAWNIQETLIQVSFTFMDSCNVKNQYRKFIIRPIVAGTYLAALRCLIRSQLTQMQTLVFADIL